MKKIVLLVFLGFISMSQGIRIRDDPEKVEEPKAGSDDEKAIEKKEKGAAEEDPESALGYPGDYFHAHYSGFPGTQDFAPAYKLKVPDHFTN